METVVPQTATVLSKQDSRQYDIHAHMLSEQFKVEGAYKGCQQTLLLALLCAGMDDVESIIEK